MVSSGISNDGYLTISVLLKTITFKDFPPLNGQWLLLLDGVNQRLFCVMQASPTCAILTHWGGGNTRNDNSTC